MIATLRNRGIVRLLAFADAPEEQILAGYRVTFGDLSSVPQGLGSSAYNVLAPAPWCLWDRPTRTARPLVELVVQHISDNIKAATEVARARG